MVSAATGSGEERALMLRAVIFGLIVSGLAVTSGFFVFGVVSRRPEIGLTASGTYTVRLIQMPEENSRHLADFVESDALKSFLQVDELFILDAGRDYVALCAGRFDSETPQDDVYDLLARVRGIEHGGERIFKDADIWFPGGKD